jgi:hypothetical protein
MKLALLTKTTSAKAMEVEDSADNIAIFEAAMKTIKAEFGS